MNELVDLPWQTQIVLVGGYIGYAIAYAGRRSTHSNIDTGAIILAFGAITLACLSIPNKISYELEEGVYFNRTLNDPMKAIIGFILTICLSILWRRSLREKANFVISNLGRHAEDGLPTAWDSIIQTSGLTHSTLVVTKKDGTIYESYHLKDFKDWPNGPCVLGNDGSIGIYVTTITEVGKDPRQPNHTRDDDGYCLTYIPASEISEIDLRRGNL